MFTKLTATAIAIATIAEAVDVQWSSPYYSGRQAAQPKAPAQYERPQFQVPTFQRPERPTFAKPSYPAPTVHPS